MNTTTPVTTPTHAITYILNQLPPSDIPHYLATLDYNLPATLEANRHHTHLTTFTLLDGRTFARDTHGTWRHTNATTALRDALIAAQNSANHYTQLATNTPTLATIWRAGSAIAALDTAERAAAVPPYACTSAALRQQVNNLTPRA